MLQTIQDNMAAKGWTKVDDPENADLTLLPAAWTNTTITYWYVFSMRRAKMLWAGTTSTLNPKQLDKTIDDIILAVRKELIAKGLVSE